MRKATLRPATIIASVVLLLLLAGSSLAREAAQMTFSRAAKITTTAAPTLSPLPPASANTVWLHIAGESVSRHVERALIDQISEQVAPVWHTAPIRFGERGVPVYVEGVSQVEAACADDEAAGCHTQAAAPAIYVEDFRENVTDGPENRDSITSALSHEIIEMLVDPGGTAPEICDPVAWADYTIDGVTVSDWTLPAFWSPASAPPYDFLRTLHYPDDHGMT